MKRALLFALFLAACDATNAAAVIGVEVGSGPHKGIVQEQQGVKVELVPMTDGTVRAYLTDSAGTPQRATSDVTMKISAPSFSPTAVTMAPAEGGAYLVGKLPGPPPAGPANVEIGFPSGVNFAYNSVPFAPGTVALAPAAAPPVAVATTGVPSTFAPPHQGTVTRVGDNLVEVVILPKGEVHTYAYTLTGQPIPTSEVSIPEVQLDYKNKPYKVKMAPDKSEPYLVGNIGTKVEIPANAEVGVTCTQPVVIYGVVYQPAVIVFSPFVVATPVLVVVPAAVIVTPIVPVIEVEIGHSHHSHYNYSKHGGKHGGKHH